jgi:hypothetical protein
LAIVLAEIVNKATVTNLNVQRGNYTQVHFSGVGYGDSALEAGISQIGVEVNIKTDPNNNVG